MRPANWKLSPEDAERIREASLFGARNADLSRAWGVTASTMHSARRGLSFAPVSDRPLTFMHLQRFCLQAVLMQ